MRSYRQANVKKPFVPSRFSLDPLTKDRVQQKITTPPPPPSNATSVTPPPKKIETFAELQLRSEVVAALTAAGATKPTLIQSLAIPQILGGRNVFCAAETGSGKTLTYLAPVFSMLRQEEEDGVLRMQQRPRAVVLVPSKELVSQIESVATSLSHVCKLRIEGIHDRKAKCKGKLTGAIDMIISTPQKFRYQLENGLLSLKDCRYVVVDEADSMFEKDFGEELRKLIGLVREDSPDCRFTFVSATVPRSLNETFKRYFNNDIAHVVTPRIHRTLPSLKQRFIQLSGHGDNKQKTLLRILFDLPPKDVPTMIFCNTLGSAKSLNSWLSSMKEALEVCGGEQSIKSVHSLISRPERKEVLTDFQKGKVSTLICTDIASRGLDTTQAKHVILYDFPKTAIDYLHRVGRTARNQSEGKATSLVSIRDRPLAALIEDSLRSKGPINTANTFKTQRPKIAKAAARKKKSSTKYHKAKPAARPRQKEQ